MAAKLGLAQAREIVDIMLAEAEKRGIKDPGQNNLVNTEGDPERLLAGRDFWQ